MVSNQNYLIANMVFWESLVTAEPFFQVPFSDLKSDAYKEGLWTTRSTLFSWDLGFCVNQNVIKSSKSHANSNLFSRLALLQKMGWTSGGLSLLLTTGRHLSEEGMHDW